MKYDLWTYNSVHLNFYFNKNFGVDCVVFCAQIFIDLNHGEINLDLNIKVIKRTVFLSIDIFKILFT